MGVFPFSRDKMKADLCQLGMSGIRVREPLAIFQTSTARASNTTVGTAVPPPPWIDYGPSTNTTVGPDVPPPLRQDSGTVTTTVNMERGTQDGDTFDGDLNGFRPGDETTPIVSQLPQDSSLQNQTGPLSDFAQTGAVTGLFGTSSNDAPLTTENKTQQPQVHPWSLPLPTRGDQGKVIEEMTTMVAVLTSELDVVKFQMDTLATQNSILLKKNEKMERDIDLVTKLVLVLGREDHKDEMETMVKDSIEVNLKMTCNEPLALDSSGDEPLAQVELTETAAKTTVPRP